MRQFAVLAFLLALLAIPVWGAAPSHAPSFDINHALRASVMVRVPEQGSGSGVIFRNGPYTLIWTAAHVIPSTQKMEKVIDLKSGQERWQISYSDVEIVLDEREGGRKVGHLTLLAEVLRYSANERGGEDLALLLVHKRNVGESVHFLADGRILRPGDKVWHVGAMRGIGGIASVSDGVFSTAGRLRREFANEDFDRPAIYDHATITTLGGSSGGGIFCGRTGECIGILTEGLGVSETASILVPARRLRDYARRARCLWAVDNSVPVPPDGARKRHQTDRPPAIPAPKKK